MCVYLSGRAELPRWRHTHPPEALPAQEGPHSLGSVTSHTEKLLNTAWSGCVCVCVCVCVCAETVVFSHQGFLFAVGNQLVQVPGPLVSAEAPEGQTGLLEGREEGQHFPAFQCLIHLLYGCTHYTTTWHNKAAFKDKLNTSQVRQIN